jgi:hypothetical protein
MAISTYLGNKLLDLVLRNTAYTPPTTVYMSLHTADPGLTGASEVTGGSYQRQSVTFAAASNRSAASNADVTFTGMPACTLTYIGLWDAQSTGNFLWGISVTSKTFEADDVAKVLSGQATVAMTSGISTYLANALLDHVLRNTTYSRPATVYMSLHTADPGLTGTNEVNGGSYGRSATAFDAAASRATQNTDQETFSGMPSCTVSHIGVWDTSSTGNFLCGGAMSGSKTYNAGDQAIINAGDLDITWT